MGYESQVGLVLTTAVDKGLRRILERLADDSLRAELTQLFTSSVTRFESRAKKQVLYFWEWSKWSADRDPGIA